MRVIREFEATAFLERVGPHLRQHPAENNLMFGLLCDLAEDSVRTAAIRAEADTGSKHERPNTSPVLLWVEGPRGSIEAVALQTPPRAIIVSRMSDETAHALVEFAMSANPALSGVIGPATTAERFASAWGARNKRSAILRVEEMVYELDRVEPPAVCAGALREATRSDENLLAAWSKAFFAETGMDTNEDGLALVRGLMAARQLFVWDDSGPVSMAAWGGRTEQGVRIRYVYTPPAERKKGYASVAVAALSQRLLDEGSPRCFLFTQSDNPTSNKIYQALGYQRVCEFRLYGFPAP